MDQLELAHVVVGVLLLVLAPLTGLFYASHRQADELMLFIQERGEAGHLTRWRAERERSARVRRGQCPNDGFPMYHAKCPHCGWTSD